MRITGNPSTLKEINSSTVVRLLYSHVELSKPAISKLSGLSLPTINKIIDAFEEEGLVRSVGMTGNEPGRKAVLYQLNKDAGCVIALCYSWKKYTCRIADIVGNTLHESVFEFDDSSFESAMASTTNAIDSMLSHATSDVKAIGVGVPGAVLPDGKLFAIPKIGVWEGFDLGSALEKRYNNYVLIENDVKLSAVGYYRKHLLDGYSDIVYIYVGNGIGSGIIINKKLYRGSNNFSGELGYMAPLNGEMPTCDYVSDGGYLEHKLNSFKFYDQDGYVRYDESTKDVLLSFLTAVAANYTSLINPAVIVFGGEAINEIFVDEIGKRITSYSPERSIPEIVFDYNDNSGIDGLVFACIGGITNELHIVESGGV